MRFDVWHDGDLGTGVWSAGRPGDDGYYRYCLTLATKGVAVTIRGRRLAWWRPSTRLLFSERYAGEYGHAGWRRSGWWGHLIYRSPRGIEQP